MEYAYKYLLASFYLPSAWHDAVPFLELLSNNYGPNKIQILEKQDDRPRKRKHHKNAQENTANSFKQIPSCFKPYPHVSPIHFNAPPKDYPTWMGSIHSARSYPNYGQ